MAEIVNGVGINEANAHVKKSRSRFLLNEPFLDSHRFAEYHPHFVIDGVSGDSHRFRSTHDARSYTLKAPLMQDVTMNKDYFMVTLRSILPFQSERVFTNPNLGDDVPADAYTSVSNFINKVKSFSDDLTNAIDAETPANNNNSLLHATLCLKKLVFLEAIFSRGSLLASLGCNLSPCLIVSNSALNYSTASIDKVIDLACQEIASVIASDGSLEVVIDGTVYVVVNSIDKEVTYTSNPLTLRGFLQKIRDTSDWSFSNTRTLAFKLNGYAGVPAQMVFNTTSRFPIDLARLWAYHLACAEYYSNDKVDYIYSADLFRQYIFSLVSRVLTYTSDYSQGYCQFAWNGQELPYDYLSAHYFNTLIQYGYTGFDADSQKALLQYFLTLFGYHRSLRFKDYFTGSRTRPLAMVTNPNYGTDVQVNNNAVSVIDVTRSIQVQRFLNAVNAAGRKYGEYIGSLFGVRPNKDMHEPIFLAHSADRIYASESENTGNAVFEDVGGSNTTQNNVTAVFRGNSSNYEYSIDVNEPCVIIGITSYDIERVYCDTINRSFFIQDRFDMFNPMMQYIGDQKVYAHELRSGNSTPFGTPFGYQFNGMQWKQMFPRCAGAFASKMLPGYAFVYNNRSVTGDVISPDFIRSSSFELDEFYLSLTGYSLGTYFHFILRQRNMDNASRPMAAQPQIL